MERRPTLTSVSTIAATREAHQERMDATAVPGKNQAVTDVLLLHHDKVPMPEYRVKNYRYLYGHLLKEGYQLRVYANDSATRETGGFPLEIMPMSFSSLVRLINRTMPKACILVINHSILYYFPFLLYLRLRRVRAITWTHGTDLQRPSKFSALVHNVEHELCNGLVLYAEHMRKYLLPRHRGKAFVANNTLNLTDYGSPSVDRKRVLARYGISTERNIIFVGRIQTRKRLQDLLDAFQRLSLEDCGLILIGRDEEGLLHSDRNRHPRIFPLGPLYGNDVLDLLTSADVFCIPGAIGLSIVDAMFCGLPVVTEDVSHGPEIMYLHNAENGFVVPKGDITQLADRLNLLLTNPKLRQQFSERARHEINTRGHIRELCKGVRECLDYVTDSAA